MPGYPLCCALCQCAKTHALTEKSTVRGHSNQTGRRFTELAISLVIARK
jgi:hypothetical protein